MKTIFTLLITMITSAAVSGQAILNEVYAFPGGSRNEFFEFYNNSNSNTSMDNYTIVTYYESGPNKGFFVLDLPNMSVAPRGYFVGSSAIPFNYQGVTNSSNSNYSWNDLAFMATHNAYLKQWVLGTSNLADGNLFYDLVPVPANFNDIFQKIGGSGASYNVFVYNNGVLMSVFLGGTGGSTFIPTYIVGLPPLHVDMAGSAPDFDIVFSGYANANTEFVTEDIGSDNGYIRLLDGYCGSWAKSSSQVTHTPGMTNGGDPSKIDGVISVESAITGGNATTGSTLNYDVVGGPADDFPVTLNVYMDNGSVPGQLDANDTYLESKVENTVADGGFSTTFKPADANVLIQTVTSSGCIDDLRFIPNLGVLAVRFTGFEANGSAGKTELKWYVAENDGAKQFIIEKSTNGKDFAQAAVVFSTGKAGSEQYQYLEAAGMKTKAFYRVKLVDNNNKISYSHTLAVGAVLTAGRITLNQNPVNSYLVFKYQSPEQTPASIRIYNTSGAVVYNETINLTKDLNTVAINLDGRVLTGLYILEVKSQYDHNSVKFIKN